MSSRFASSMTLKRALTRALSARYTLLSCEGSFTWASGGGTRRALHKCKSGSGSRTIRTPLAPKKTRAAHAATGAIPLAGESCAETTLKPTSLQLRTLFISSAVPMVGFGFMDNFIMVQAGGYIDATLGVQLGLATLTAAAMGQVVSDVSGVVFGGTVERFLHRIKMIRAPGLTEAQRHLSICRNAAMAGSVVGVMIGCMLGASSLLFIDLDAHERAKRGEALHDVLSAMLADHKEDLRCDACTVYLAKLSATPLKSGTQMKFLKDTADISFPRACAEKCTVQRGISPDGDALLYVPVVKGDDLEAVLEFRRIPVATADGDDAFSLEEERTARIMARHMAIFMDRLSSV